MKAELIDQLKNGLIVSCQAPEDSPLSGPAILSAIAMAAEDAGAKAIRAQGLDNIRAIRHVVKVPIIGLVKRSTDSPIYITPTLDDILDIIEAGADIVAIDATNRLREGGVSAFDFISAAKSIRKEFLLMADVDELQSAVIAQEAGADFVGTTLSGYVHGDIPDGPDLNLVKELSANLSTPVIAEGRYNSPAQVKEAFRNGAFAVCVGTAITDPWTTTKRFVSQLK